MKFNKKYKYLLNIILHKNHFTNTFFYLYFYCCSSIFQLKLHELQI